MIKAVSRDTETRSATLLVVCEFELRMARRANTPSTLWFDIPGWQVEGSFDDYSPLSTVTLSIDLAHHLSAPQRMQILTSTNHVQSHAMQLINFCNLRFP